ncbi:hypothetical protein DL96DRAFT_1758873 [Flagelloscypha sp. PMI_526]|nr:hypothetical protein DL96DRAFT_1758873 [Flagelloscypha sp. PMI_526]
MTWDKLPFELVLCTVTFATLLDGPTGINLTLVSHEFQDIADQILFRNFYFRENRRKQTDQLLETMFSPSCSPRLLRARGHITSFRGPAGNITDHLILKTVLNHCSNLRTLISGVIPRSCYSINGPSNLNTIGVTYDGTLSLRLVDELRDQPFFRGITYVIIEHPGMESVQASNLTHLFLQFHTYGTPPWTVHPLPVHLQLCLVYLTCGARITDEWFHKLLSGLRFADIEHRGRVDKRLVRYFYDHMLF